MRAATLARMKPLQNLLRQMIKPRRNAPGRVSKQANKILVSPAMHRPQIASSRRRRTPLATVHRKTTSLPPTLMAGALASIRWLKQHNEVRMAHQERAATLKARLAAAGLPVMPSASHIVPVMVGNPVHTKLISDMLLQDYGVYVQPINYPTVAKGTERLRFTPSPDHDDRMMDALVEVMDALWTRCNVMRFRSVA